MDGDAEDDDGGGDDGAIDAVATIDNEVFPGRVWIGPYLPRAVLLFPFSSSDRIVCYHTHHAHPYRVDGSRLLLILEACHWCMN